MRERERAVVSSYNESHNNNPLYGLHVHEELTTCTCTCKGKSECTL